MNDPSRDIAKLDYDLIRHDTAERLRLQGEFSQTVFKGLTLTNGGALVALFTFIGNSDANFDSGRLWYAFACFAAGLAFNLASTMSAFFAQAYFMQAGYSDLYDKQIEMYGGEGQYGPAKAHETRAGNRWEVGAIAAAILSLSGFIGGCAYALAGVLV